eukprot:PhM_4_TR14115/c4_g1_i7/m.42938
MQIDDAREQQNGTPVKCIGSEGPAAPNIDDSEARDDWLNPPNGAPATSDAQKTSPLEPEPKTRKTDALQTPHKTPSDAHPASGAWQKPLFAPTPKAAPGSSKAGVQTTTIRLPTPNFFFC